MQILKHLNSPAPPATGVYAVAQGEKWQLPGRCHHVSSTQRVLNILLAALVFTCAMRNWQYFVGVRLMGYDLIILLFIITFITASGAKTQIHKLPRALNDSVKWLWVIYFLSLMTFVVVWYMSLPTSWEMYFKGVISLLLYTVGFTCIISYVSSQSTNLVQTLLKIYILGAVASSIFSFFEVTLALQGIDLGKIIFGAISTYKDPDTKPYYYAWSNFFRAQGFAGVNAQATYLASVLPLLIFAKPFSKAWKNQLMAATCLIGLVLTWSRTGFLALVISIVIYACLGYKHSGKTLRYLVIAALPLALLYMQFSSGAWSMLESRGLGESIDDIAESRTAIAAATFDSLLSYPFGYGLNQFSVVVKNSDIIDFTQVDKLLYNRQSWQNRQDYENVHSSYLSILSEGGWLLLIAYLAFYISIIRICYRSNSQFRVAALCSTGALLAGGLTNNTLELFNTKLLIILLALLTIGSENGQSKRRVLVRR